MNTLPVREVFISPSSRRLSPNREHEDLILRGSLVLPRGLSVCKELLREGSRYSQGQLPLSVGGLGAQIRAAKLQEMLPGKRTVQGKTGLERDENELTQWREVTAKHTGGVLRKRGVLQNRERI